MLAGPGAPRTAEASAAADAVDITSTFGSLSPISQKYGEQGDGQERTHYSTQEKHGIEGERRTQEGRSGRCSRDVRSFGSQTPGREATERKMRAPRSGRMRCSRHRILPW